MASTEHPVPEQTARPQSADDIAADLIARCPEHGDSTEAFPECRCAAARKAAAWLAENPDPASEGREQAPVDGLRQRIALAVGAHRNGPASDGLGWFRDEADERACYALADAVLPLAVGEREAGRRDGLREGAAALQAVIDRNAAHVGRSQSHVALRGAREIVIGLLGQDATPAAPLAEPVVAYRARSGYLFCLNCGTGGGLTALTSEDLPDGGLCADCDADVFAVAEAVPPTLAALRDALGDPRPIDLPEALESARTLLAAHARELAERVDGLAAPDCADMSSLDDAWECGNTDTATALRQYADDLEQQAAGGEV